jgi:N12 class adenine-specific DNA methylase/adenine-specific DNA methylase
MASKYRTITGLYESTIRQVTHSAAAWTAFLRSACRNYKLRFDEQILVYAQRPDATAVLEIERWNNAFGRWVNKGAKGIAVFDGEHNGAYRLKHYFDISDTHGSRFERPVLIWNIRPEFEEAVIETLENSFGDLEDMSSPEAAIFSVARNAVEDNMADYLRDLMYTREGSFLEEPDEYNVEVEYRDALINSVAYMLMARCGLNPDEYFEPEDFQHVTDFNTPGTVNALGLAASDIAEMCLREIANTVLNLQRQENIQNRTFAGRDNQAYHVLNHISGERSPENDRSIDLPRGERIPRPEPDRAGGRASSPWQIRVAPKEVPPTEPPRPVPEFPDGGDAERTPDGNRTDGAGTAGTDHPADGAGRGRDGGTESPRPDGVGGADEQHPAQRRGNDTERTDLRIKPLPTQTEQLNIFGEAEETAKGHRPEPTPSAFSVSRQIIDEVLTGGGNEENSLLRIASYFKKDHMTAANAEFLRKEYRTGGKGFIFGGNKVSVWFDQSGLSIAVGDTVRSADAVTLTWERAARRIRELLDLGRFMPQGELDKADGNELKELADRLWDLHRDRADGAEFDFIDPDCFRHGHPDDTARIAELLAQPEERAKILDGLEQFAADYAQDNRLLRFRYSESHLRSALETLTDLQIEPLVFAADESVSTARPGFITQDEVDRVLTGNGDVQNGKYGIYAYFLQGHTAKEKAGFLKDHYGIGGFGRTGFDEWHDSKGIAYSRENNHMPYDKVILSWPKVARRIDELIAENRYLTQDQLVYLPEYEKEELAGHVFNFYPRRPEELLRPFPFGTEYYEGKMIVREQLDDPERVAAILAQMAAILDNTADFDRNYTRMRKAFDDLTAYQKGEYSLFTPKDKPTEEQARTAQPATPAQRTTEPLVQPINEAAEYDLQLGATVCIGTERYEIYSLGENIVVLQDASAPLFTREMPRAEFDRKLRENRLNDGLIKPATVPARGQTPEPEPAPTTDTPRVLYKKYLPRLIDEILQSELYGFLQDEDTQAYEAEIEIGNWLDYAAESGDYPGLREALELPDFRDWLREDILDRVYQDVSGYKADAVRRNETAGSAPDWAKRPGLSEQIREELSLRNFAVSDELIAEGISEYRAHGGRGDIQDIADFIENEYLTEGSAPDRAQTEVQAGETPYIPQKDDRYEIQGRFFVVDGVDVDYETVSLRDVTFEGNTGFPIFRSETFEFIRMYEPIPRQPGYEDWSEVATEENAPDAPDTPSDDVSEYLPQTPAPHKAPNVVNFPGEIVLQPVHIPQTGEPEPTGEVITPAWERERERERRTRANVFDPHPEIPQAERHNFRITDDDLGAGGAKSKYRNNVEAIKILQTVESENRFATPEEQEILSRYVGWGALQNAFDPDRAEWANECAELKALLTPEEWESARATTLNAHYTSPTVIKAIYKAVEGMGFKTGNILEPSCGIGNFFGLLPGSMSDSKLFGVELDSLTGRIARQLYQKTGIAIQGFEKTELPDSFFDLAIGNVPFGSYGVSDKRYDKHKFHIHDYFFARTLDKVRPGGVIAFVTSRFTLDKRDSSVRKYIAQRAELLGAIRLPMTAFKANAGTEVTADIIFLQKRDRVTDIEPDWVHLGTADGIGVDGDSEQIPVNAYFAEHPDMILGTMSKESGSRMYGAENSVSCVPFEDADLAEQLAEAISNIHAEITDYERGDDEPEEDNSVPADPRVRNFSYTVVDGQIFYRQDSRMVPVELPVTAQNRVKGLIEIRECVRNLIMYQTDDYPEHTINAEQAKLNRLYDSFTHKYGPVNSRGNNMAFAQDSAYCLLCSLEVLNENGELERKADMFRKRTIKPHIPITHVDTATEALAASMNEKGRVDIEYMSELTGFTTEKLIQELEGVIFFDFGNPDRSLPKFDPEKMKLYEKFPLVTADEYLSGDVREKLAKVENFNELPGDEFQGVNTAINVRALKAALPEDLTAAEISVRLGATWIPEDVIQQFMYELLQTSVYARERIKVHYSAYNGEWNITQKSADGTNIHTFNTYGTQRVSAYKIIEDSLNLRDVRVFDKQYTPEGDEKRVLNKRETAIAQAKQEIIRSKFEEWIWKGPDRRERLCRLYNDKFNSIRPRVYDGSHLTFPGMNPEIKLRKHQVDAIAHILYGGNTLLAHEVGAGKTFEMVAAAMESKRIGLCNKSLIVVPNHITEQWAAEFLQLYPSANILVATRKDFETKNRKKFCARIATGDYDAIIIGHSQFEKIPMSAGRQRFMLKRQIDELVDGIDEVKRNRGEKYTIKQMEKMKKSLELRLEKLNDRSRKDDVVDFEELGIDRLYIDEAHYFKNLYLISKMRNVGGIAQTEAQKSSDLFMKTQYLDETQKGRGTVFATGTPISNSMVEMYTMQRYLQYKELVKQGLQHFDAWASTFGETVTAVELAPEGTGFRSKTRFARFYNLPELMAMFRMVADIQTGDMLNLPVPKANYHNIVAKPSEWQKEMVAGLAERAEAIRSGSIDPAQDNMLLVTNDGRKLALDQRLMNPMLPDDPEGKVSVCAENVFGLWERHRENRLTQLVFSDLSTPKGDGSFNVYDDLKAKLIVKGIPEHEIAFIHTADTEAKKKELFAKVRQGKVRVLMGSTQKMGAGTNVQDKLIALHDLDCPWRPSDLAQRLGRIVRQGNKNPEVEIFRYVTESTFDSYLYQLVENKQKFIAQIMTGKTPVRQAEDCDDTALSYAEIKALATGNPLIIEKAQLESDVSKLKILHAAHLSQRYSLEDKILKEYPQDIKRLMERIAGYEADAETVAKHPADKDRFPPMTIGGILYAEKAEAGKAIIEACKAMKSPDPTPIGEYRGFGMTLSFDTFAKEYRIDLKGALTHTVRLGTDIHGNITRLDNALEGFEESLRRLSAGLASTNEQLAAAKGEVDRPFPQETEYKEKSARLKELNVLLKLDEKDNQVFEAEPDEADAEPPPRVAAMAR